MPRPAPLARPPPPGQAQALRRLVVMQTARMTGIHEAVLHEVLDGKRRLPVRYLEMLARYFRVPVWAVAGEEEDRD